MKVNIERLNYNQLRNDEVIMVVIYLITICSKYDNKKLFLEKSYEELASFLPLLESLKVHVRKNKKVEQLNNLDAERDTLINCFCKVVKSFSPVEIPEISTACGVLSALLEAHQAKTIASDNRLSETERLQKLEADIRDSVEVQNAIQQLELQVVVNRLFAANKEYSILFQDYIAEKSAREQVDVLALRKSSLKALGQYFDAVQYCAFAHEENDYTGLVKELSQLVAYVNQQLKTRATRRKNSKDTTEEPSIELPTIEESYY
jgi:hypothetical protein